LGFLVCKSGNLVAHREWSKIFREWNYTPNCSRCTQPGGILCERNRPLVIFRLLSIVAGLRFLCILLFLLPSAFCYLSAAEISRWRCSLRRQFEKQQNGGQCWKSANLRKKTFCEVENVLYFYDSMQGPCSKSCCNLRHCKLLQKSSVTKFVYGIAKCSCLSKLCIFIKTFKIMNVNETSEGKKVVLKTWYC
jgi:hypothetical protein